MDEDANDSAPAPRVGATTELPHDRVTVARFREAFPRARWSDRLNAWFVPGRTAQKRISRWLAEMEAEADAFADEKGRDAFAFDPFESRYLKSAPASFEIRTPYLSTVVNEIREIPYARWDADRRLWTVPYQSFDELRRRWPAIEAAAARSEPEARMARREAIRGTKEDEALKARARERRCKRYPVPAVDRPPLGCAIGTHVRVVFFIGTDGELVDPATMSAFYFPMKEGGEYVWASWRPGVLEELVTTWPARTPPGEEEVDRGWWIPTLEELRNARRDAKSRRRARQRRGRRGVNPVSAQQTALKDFQFLSPLEPREIVGLWRGRGIPTGHPLDGVLENLGWFGKRFNADMRADALLFWSGKRRLIALDPGIAPLRLALRFHKVGGMRIARNLFSRLQRGLRAKGPVAELRARRCSTTINRLSIISAESINTGSWER
jgi:hypothetical protein